MAEIEELTIRTIKEVYVAWKDKLDTSGSVRLNLGQVKQADTAGLQLLLALHLECQRTKKVLEWVEPSAELIQIAELLGLQTILGFKNGKPRG